MAAATRAEDASSRHCVIVGAGHGGGTVAALLRQFGWPGPITLIGDEPIAPYQRPPLSKAWLKGEVDADDLILRPLEFYRGSAIDLRLATPVASIDRASRLVRLADGDVVPYDVLILATGASARLLPLPGLALNGVRTLRTAADAELLKAQLTVGQRLAVIGGGYVGLEVAASARKLGVEVVIFEREPRVLARVACPELSSLFEDYHRNQGVKFELGAQIEALTGVDGQLKSVILADGRAVPCDVAVVGVGAQPNDALARQAGLTCGDGVLVSLDAQTSDPAIYAIGDLTRRPVPRFGEGTWRLESVPNALEQARQAAAHLCGRPAPSAETPWFWSDQYDLKLQIAGLAHDVARIVTRGDASRPASGFAIFHLSHDDRVQAVEAINAVPEFMVGRQLIGQRTRVDPAKLSDPGTPMKSVAQPI